MSLVILRLRRSASGNLTRVRPPPGRARSAADSTTTCMATALRPAVPRDREARLPPGPAGRSLRDRAVPLQVLAARYPQGHGVPPWVRGGQCLGVLREEA